jgi:hypothetical protein
MHRERPRQCCERLAAAACLEVLPYECTVLRTVLHTILQVTRELCEAAHGGQVLLSHEGWVHLRQVRCGGGGRVKRGSAVDR